MLVSSLFPTLPLVAGVTLASISFVSGLIGMLITVCTCCLPALSHYLLPASPLSLLVRLSALSRPLSPHGRLVADLDLGTKQLARRLQPADSLHHHDDSLSECNHDDDQGTHTS